MDEESELEAMRRTWLRAGAAFIGFTLLLLAGCSVEARTQYPYVDRSTGSWKFFTSWVTGQTSSMRHKTSPLEELARKRNPSTFRHRWAFVNGTGKNIFGRTLVFRDGSGGGAADLKPEVVEAWMSRHSEEEAMELYRFLSSADTQSTAERVESILLEAGPPGR